MFRLFLLTLLGVLLALPLRAQEFEITASHDSFYIVLKGEPARRLTAFLTGPEMDELRRAYTAALANDGTLAPEAKELETTMQAFRKRLATAEDRAKRHLQSGSPEELRLAAVKTDPSLQSEGLDIAMRMEEFRMKMDAAMAAADPAVQPILDKMIAPPPRGPGDPPPAMPATSATTTR